MAYASVTFGITQLRVTSTQHIEYWRGNGDCSGEFLSMFI